MTDRDMRPTRFDLTLEYAREFVTEWFDQNPLGQIGIVGMRGGIGERICEMSGASLLLVVSLSTYLLFFLSISIIYREPAGCAPCDI